ncbi:MAG: hypothetical protein WDA22_04665 [Bacteroidota bacterium]
MKNILQNIVLILVGLIIGSCQKDLPNQPKANQSPLTRLWLSSSTTLNETSSRQHAYWYGEDPDGYVNGFLIATPESIATSNIAFPDTFTYAWTTKTDSIIALPLIKARSIFTIIARATDNTFKEHSLLQEGAIIRLTPQPYWDKNGNGIFDGGDLLLTSLNSSIDKKSASQLLPIRNTPPKVFFSVNPIDSATIQQPDTTFTVATFSWYGTDIDGDNTISNFRLALNDSGPNKRWFSISGAVKLVTFIAPRLVTNNATGEVEADVYTGTFPSMQFRGKISGLKLNSNNVLYIQARDVAGDSSVTITMPSSPTTKKWYVKKPTSRMLVVVDYNQFDRQTALNNYRNALEQGLPGKSFSNFDILDVGYGLTASEKANQFSNPKYGSFVPAYLNPALIHTLKLYDIVMWISDLSPSFIPAQVSLFNYNLTGGKVIFTTGFPTNEKAIIPGAIRTINDYAPIDSISTDTVSTPSKTPPVHTNADTRIPAGTKVFSLESGYPDLAFDSTQNIHSVNMRRVYKRTDARYLYELDSSKFYYTNGTFRYQGSPEIATIDANRSIVFIAVPLHLLNGRQKNLPNFFKKVIVDEFGLN